MIGSIAQTIRRLFCSGDASDVLDVVHHGSDDLDFTHRAPRKKMRKTVTFHPDLGLPETDKSSGKEWRLKEGIQGSGAIPKSYSREEIETRVRVSEAATDAAYKDANLEIKSLSTSVNLADLIDDEENQHDQLDQEEDVGFFYEEEEKSDDSPRREILNPSEIQLMPLNNSRKHK